MTTEPLPVQNEAGVTKTPRALARARKRQSLARFWREYRTHRGGLWGLAGLILIALIAVFAPTLVAPTRRASPTHRGRARIAQR